MNDHRPAGLRSLRTAATGLLLVLVDVRVNSLDVVPDVVGWVLAAIALASLRPVHPLFSLAALAAAVAIVPGVATLNTEDPHPAATLGEGVLGAVVLFTTCTALIAVRPHRQAGLNLTRWAQLAASTTLAIIWLLPDRDLDLTPRALLAGLTMFVAFIAFIVILYRVPGDTPGNDIRPPGRHDLPTY